MKWFPALNYLPRDNELVKIHGVFRSKNLLKNKEIFVAVEWKDGVTSSLPIEMATFLAPGYTFQDKKVVSQSQCERQIVKILSLEKVEKSSNHYHYVYRTDKGFIKLAGFEIARTLFFHNAHLIRAVYTANGLGGIALVNSNVSPVEINFPVSSQFPIRFINTKNKRTHLSWMLLDTKARESAFSVFKTFHDDHEELGFKFVPPDLSGWLLDVSVASNSDKTYVYGVRIERIIEALMDENFADIVINHPKNKEKSTKGRKDASKGGHTSLDDIEPELDLGAIPSLGSRLNVERKKGFSFHASGIQSASFSKAKAVKGTANIPPSDAQEIAQEIAGVGIPERDGSAQEFSPSINNDDEIEETINLPQKFSLFAEVIEEVAKKDGINLIQEAKCYRFPAPANNSKVVYQTTYEGLLKYFVAILELKGSHLVLVEADTSNLNNPKGASTLILGLKEDAKTNFEEILQCFSDKGAQWNHDFIKERCIFFSPCRHPSIKANSKVRTDLEYKTQWVSDIKAQLEGMTESPLIS